MHRTLSEVDRGDAPLDSEALIAVRDVLTESLGLLLITPPSAAAEITAAGTVAGEDALACVTGDVALLPAARLAGDGRWDDILLVYADRLGCADASYACLLRDHYRVEKRWADADRLRDEMQRPASRCATRRKARTSSGSREAAGSGEDERAHQRRRAEHAADDAEGESGGRVPRRELRARDQAGQRPAARTTPAPSRSAAAAVPSAKVLRASRSPAARR